MKTDELLALLFLVLIIAAAIWLYRKLHKPDLTKLYNAKTILTDREYEFYKRLKPLADEYGLSIYSKVRLADLIEPKPKAENPYWMECFNKIKAKHIDFALADEDTAIVALIELDDTSHARPDRVERDDFVNAVLENTGYTLLRTYGELDVIEEYLSM
ncbi:MULTISPECIES: DUF2726 domain-containing protein [Ruminococcus]|uniref:DUF2726 domain-containing protein n=1 Tax=Ruminococcus flavefaciens TaxID=1265 RepID=A0A1M7G576_RUMFL|nr:MULTISPECIES: DUF2726 domain-containing protein [Ruminococcus]MCR4794708.1 DUF2726 domain-containing protein [Ruminococcus sp.]SHM11346.1 Protein of unknown function [Ruminococcus flavefaciens]